MSTLETLAGYGLYIQRNFLSVALCDRVREEICESEKMVAKVYENGTTSLNESVRKARRAKVSDETIQKIHGRFRTLITPLNRHFGEHLTCCQVPSFMFYRKGDFFKAHRDNAEHYESNDYVAKRKVSAVIFLNSGNLRPGDDEFGGGALNFYKLDKHLTKDNIRIPLIGEKRLLVAFRSDVFHEVSPVTQGLRYTLVSWFY